MLRTSFKNQQQPPGREIYFLNIFYKLIFSWKFIRCCMWIYKLYASLSRSSVKSYVSLSQSICDINNIWFMTRCLREISSQLVWYFSMYFSLTPITNKALDTKQSYVFLTVIHSISPLPISKLTFSHSNDTTADTTITSRKTKFKLSHTCERTSY